MLKRAISAALICLHVVPVNSFAATSLEIDRLLMESRPQAEETIQQKLKENQELIAEITKLELQINEIQSNLGENRERMKVNLYIAGGTALATGIATFYFQGKVGRSEIADHMNLLFSTGAFLVGTGATINFLGNAGYRYLLVRIDEDKLPALQEKMAELKQTLEKQNAEFLK
ncbi:hypothetical protein QJS83_00815 [Bdellovibrio sp. 22V]|uniref:hypothetical protein n=1 Tax=Bdellovibrio TaxID=958 RepID=UPI002542BF09|nr:hypothetical protein [Bdellovibrio sp. 22V]WII72407.1 hypothetical protein QJS83_00815 [Bdellovibrio sp. 22V]